MTVATPAAPGDVGAAIVPVPARTGDRPLLRRVLLTAAALVVLAAA